MTVEGEAVATISVAISKFTSAMQRVAQSMQRFAYTWECIDYKIRGEWHRSQMVGAR